MVTYVLNRATHCGTCTPPIKLGAMAYLKPPWFVRKIFNKVAMATGVGNSQTLTVIKRVSKQPQQIPVVVPEVGGVKYLVSTRGEAEWVRNVRADPNVKLGDTKYVASRGSRRGAGAGHRRLPTAGGQGRRELLERAARRRRPPDLRADAGLNRAEFCVEGCAERSSTTLNAKSRPTPGRPYSYTL